MRAKIKTLQEVQSIIESNKQNLIEKFNITQIGIFGSYAREEQTPESDIDILVNFSEVPGLEFFSLAKFLECILDEKVDLVSRGGIRPDRWRYIEKDIIYV